MEIEFVLALSPVSPPSPLTLLPHTTSEAEPLPPGGEYVAEKWTTPPDPAPLRASCVISVP